MHEFLNYELFGIMTVQYYLIVAVGCFAIDAAFDKKGKSFAKLLGCALIWPWSIVALALALLACMVLGIITIAGKIKK